MAKHPPTPEQQAIIDFALASKQNMMINAYAGTGKTATLEMLAGAMPKDPILYLAFSKRVVTDVEKAKKAAIAAGERPPFPDTTVFRTFNSIGHRIWAQAVGNVTLDTDKTRLLWRDAMNALPAKAREAFQDSYFDVTDAVNTAKTVGYAPEDRLLPRAAARLVGRDEFFDNFDVELGDDEKALVDNILIESILGAYKGRIDFNDQIYMPALFGGTFPRYPTIMVDEVQDLNATNHALLRRLAKGGSRVIAVGDPCQSIFGFRGAVASGMGKLRKEYSMEEFSLSLSFRCPKAVVENARWRVPDYRWHKQGGIVQKLEALEPENIPADSAIICRNNAPLIGLAFRLLRAGRSIKLVGSDIGPRITKIMAKFGPDTMPRAAVHRAIDAWVTEKLERAKNPNGVLDMASCMSVFADKGETLRQAIAYADQLFRQEGHISLLTGHKSKGGEWDVVFHLDPWLIKHETDEQEQNLRYVVQTRSLNEYYEIDGAMINC